MEKIKTADYLRLLNIKMHISKSASFNLIPTIKKIVDSAKENNYKIDPVECRRYLIDIYRLVTKKW